MKVHVLRSSSTCVLEDKGWALVLTAPTGSKVISTRLVLSSALTTVERHETREVMGCIGVLQRGKHTFLAVLTSVDAVQPVQSLLQGVGAEPIWRVRKVSFLCLEDGIWASEAEVEHPCLAISKILDNGFFYCSGDTSFDITSRHSARFAGDPHNPNVFDPRPRWTSPEIDHDPRFLWNTFLLNPLLAFRSMLPRRSREAFDGRTFAMPLIQGYIGSREVRLGGELTLLRAVSRLGWESAGTRFNRRGIDAAGNVGNFAETETILRTATTCWTFVQIRGSVPLYWSERCAQFSVDLTITRPLLTSLNPFLRHFSSLISHYSRIHSINLMRRANKGFLGAEAPLGEAYATLWEESCGRAERVEQRVAYEEFDFGEDKREQGIEDIPRLLKEAVGDVVGEFGGTLLRVGSEGEVPQLVRAQEGVFRVNCRDCLDRTNVAESILSSLALDLHLRQAGPGLAPLKRSSLEAAHRLLFSENGDALSTIYTGAGAMNSTYTRTGRWSHEDAVENVEKSEQRIFHAIFLDASKQWAIDELTGKAGDAVVVVCVPAID